mmetsp:Transcript_6105/g.19443  ORF Transcript_6105/g.19443 Transcript_6105/m.19443 type:complete len:163 (+) Transcript_6105:128-616(+)
MAQPLITLVDWKKYHFLIMDAPNDVNLHVYIEQLRKHNVTDVVRICEKTYDESKVEGEGMAMHELAFADGAAPPAHVLDSWLNLVDHKFKHGDSNETIAVHCMAGLGRAPVLVAIALIEAGLEWEQAVDHIRSKRRGVMNAKQLKYLQSYKRRSQGCSCTLL